MKNQRWRCTWIRELWISANSQSLDRFDNRLMNRSMTNTTNACTTDLLESIILPTPNGHSIRWERCIEERREEERGVCRVVEETNQTKCNWKIEPCFPSTSICCCSFFSYIFSIRFIWLSELFYLRNAVQCVNTEYKQCGRCSCFSFILHLRFFFSSASFHTERSLTSFALCRTRSQYVSFRTTTRIQCAIYFSFFFSVVKRCRMVAAAPYSCRVERFYDTFISLASILTCVGLSVCGCLFNTQGDALWLCPLCVEKKTNRIE